MNNKIKTTTLTDIFKAHDVVEIIITILDARDPYTFSHSMRVADISEMIADELNISKEIKERTHIAAHLHDIGKIGISDVVLNKPGKLLKDEMIEMQAHSRIGYNILKKIPAFKEIAEIVHYHHERYDGLGYPVGLKQNEIPIESRIIAVADTFDAITSDRSYRKGRHYKEALNEINSHSGEQFCPHIVETFNDIFSKISSSIEHREFSASEHLAFEGHEDLMHSRKI